jgi:hypothetical protein
MEEDIGAPVIGDDEAEPLAGVEPLHAAPHDRTTVLAF